MFRFFEQSSVFKIIYVVYNYINYRIYILDKTSTSTKNKKYIHFNCDYKILI